MAHYLDVASWARREVFEFYRGFDKPYFNICAQLDVTNLLTLLKQGREARAKGGELTAESSEPHPSYPSVSMTYHYFALRIANEIEPFRYRLKEGKVLVHDVIHGGTTVLLPNETFTLAYFDYDPDFGKFIDGATRAVEEARSGDGAFRPRNDDAARVHFTVLPLIAFTSFSHARNWGSEDSVPKIAFGKFVEQNQRRLLPISVEVHHALVDGLHVGRYLERMQEALFQPEGYL